MFHLWSSGNRLTEKSTASNIQNFENSDTQKMKDQFFLYTDKFVQFTQADKELLISALTFRQVASKTELVSYNKPTNELF